MSCRVCILGSGPAGLYTAKYLLKSLPGSIIHIFESLPTPFGLVRSGVAPDHPNTKAVINEFTEILGNSRVKFFGNCKIERVDDVRNEYSAVVVATGANGDRDLGIDGEGLFGVSSARKFVNWYNGYPFGYDQATEEFQKLIRMSDTAVIVGQGNVAIDVARILLSPIERLKHTDICRDALDALKLSSIRKVYLVGRRGPVQAACTTKELREVSKIDGVCSYVLKRDLEDGLNQESKKELDERVYKRKFEVLNGLEKLEDHSLKNDSGSKQLLFRFLLTPKQIVGDKEGHVSEFVFSRNKLEGPAFQQVSVSDNSSLEESFQTQLVFKSIGYKAEQIIGLPFDLKKSIIPSLNGRVSSGNEDFPGVYVSGWIKRGAHGIIGTNIPDAQETASSISEDWERGLLRRFNDLKFAPAATIKKNAIVDFNGWLKIDQEERNQGVKEGKPREKMTQISNMINASKK